MAAFSLDIERLYKELTDNGKELRGIFCIQYPMYCIHAVITDVTPDDLDNFDRVVMDFFIRKPTFNPFQIGCLMGTSKSLVEHRIDKLAKDGLLEKAANGYQVTLDGRAVFAEKKGTRVHKRSYDFYLDGLSLKPLHGIFYGPYYQSKFFNEEQAYFRTSKTGETYVVKPFAPDIVHTPPNRDRIIENIMTIDRTERENYAIPIGIQSVDDLSFSKLSFHLLISVSKDAEKLVKEVIDGFALFSLRENITYLEAVKRNVESFQSNLSSRIENLEFKIITSRPREQLVSNSERLSLASNWHEVDRYGNSRNRCFSFSTEDLVKVVQQFFDFPSVEAKHLINTYDSIALNVTKPLLMESSNKTKVIEALIRARDYKVWSNESGLDKNVFLIYLYYSTDDPFVGEVIELRSRLKNSPEYPDKISLGWIEKTMQGFHFNHRELLTAAGEFALLEIIDIERHMLSIN